MARCVPHRFIAVIGAGKCNENTARLAYQVGWEIAVHQYGLVCGGLGGVMEAAARGALDAEGITLGILPGDDVAEANPYLSIAIPTGLGHARNIIVVKTASATIAISGGYGTLSEIALAQKMNIPVISLKSWDIQGVIIEKDPWSAVARAVACITEKMP